MHDRYALRRMVREAGQRLEAAGVASGAHDARVLAEDLLGKPLLLVDSADETWEQAFEERIARRVAREPLQLILGRMWFRGLQLEARPGVFIVRPETEVVAGTAIAALQTMVRAGITQPIAVDLCTGSGAIAAALAAEVPQAQVRAVEMASSAVELARANCERVAPGRVEVTQADAADPGTLAQLDGHVDVVVSNPPYVPAGMIEDEETALFDPDLALFGGGENGLEIPLRIIERAASLLRPGGILVMEHDPTQSAALRKAALTAGFTTATTGHDLTTRDRYLSATR